ncbi:MAG: glycosyltransferase family 4 protein [Clostridiales bacterium]|nr:glycosyltransferase family 4 protein [Clostridiales bacterium]
MKIAHIVFGLLTGGIETMLVNIANIQAQNPCHKISIYIINNIVNEELLSQFAPTIKIHKINRPIGSKNPCYLAKINIKLLEENPEIIHIHKANIINYILPLFRKRIVLTQHENIIDEDIKSVSKIKRIISISESVKNDLNRKTGTVSTVVHNGIDVKRFKKRTTQYKTNNNIKCVTLGRLYHEIKGQDILIDAFALLNRECRNINIHLDIIGDGPSRSYLEKLRNLNNLNDIISFLGVKEQDYIMEHLCDYDLFILPSLTEGFGISVLESMASKVPVLVSDIPGPADLIENGKYGYLFKAGDALDCTVQIKKIIHTGIDESTIIKAYDKALTYDISATAQNYIKLYGESPHNQ